MDIGIFLTALALPLAFAPDLRAWLRSGRPAFDRDMLIRSALAMSWLVSFMALMSDARMSRTVLSMVVMDLLIAGVALVVSTHHPKRYDARTIGGLSMAMMPAHWIVSATGGGLNWALYATACNAVFVAQCLISGGWFHGVGRAISRVFARVRPVFSLRSRG